jgi:hypothetical protein
MAILTEKVGLSNADMRKLRSMRAGMPVDLQVVSPNATKRVRTEFIGMDGIRALIIKFPDEGKWGNLRDAIYADNSMVVRYILEDGTGEIIAFKVKITLVLSKPGNYVFTTFPLSIQSHELRSEMRSQTQVPASLMQIESDQLLGKGHILDLSSSGCRLGISRQAMKAKLFPKNKVKLQVRTAPDNHESLIGTIMNARNDEVDQYYGIKFEASEKTVEGLLSQLLLSGD